MSWEYRVVRETHSANPGQHIYIMHEVSADGYTAIADPPFGESRTEFLDDFHAMIRALTLPVLEWRDGLFVEVEGAIDPENESVEWVGGNQGDTELSPEDIQLNRCAHAAAIRLQEAEKALQRAKEDLGSIVQEYAKSRPLKPGDIVGNVYDDEIAEVEKLEVEWCGTLNQLTWMVKTTDRIRPRWVGRSKDMSLFKKENKGANVQSLSEIEQGKETAEG